MESVLKINGHNFKPLCYRHTLQKICKNNEHFFFIAFLSHVASINAFFSRLQAEYFRHAHQLNKGKKSEKSRLIFLWAVTDRSGTFLLA